MARSSSVSLVIFLLFWVTSNDGSLSGIYCSWREEGSRDSREMVEDWYLYSYTDLRCDRCERKGFRAAKLGLLELWSPPFWLTLRRLT